MEPATNNDDFLTIVDSVLIVNQSSVDGLINYSINRFSSECVLM